MSRNMSKVDSTLRIIAAGAIAALYFTNVINGFFSIVLIAFSGLFLFTGFTSFCPLYVPLKINTCPARSNQNNDRKE